MSARNRIKRIRNAWAKGCVAQNASDNPYHRPGQMHTQNGWRRLWAFLDGHYGVAWNLIDTGGKRTSNGRTP
jgi:hypothetical protein